MKTKEKYKIEFRGLPNGEHFFDIKIDDSFFELIEESEIKKGNLNVEVDLNKKTQMLTLNFFIEGTVSVQCDRCLDFFDLELEAEETLFVKFGEESSDITDVDDIQTLAHEEHELDLTQHIYEYICLNLPCQVIHPDDMTGKSTCSKDMLKQIEALKPKEEKKKKSGDPRWDKLKDFL